MRPQLKLARLPVVDRSDPRVGQRLTLGGVMQAKSKGGSSSKGRRPDHASLRRRILTPPLDIAARRVG